MVIYMKRYLYDLLIALGYALLASFLLCCVLMIIASAHPVPEGLPASSNVAVVICLAVLVFFGLIVYVIWDFVRYMRKKLGVAATLFTVFLRIFITRFLFMPFLNCWIYVLSLVF